MIGRCQNCGKECDELIKVFGYLVCPDCEARAYMRPGVR